MTRRRITLQWRICTQPNVRPIVRGKVRTNVEFGAKVSISLVGGYAKMESLQWDSFNKGGTL